MRISMFTVKWRLLPAMAWVIALCTSSCSEKRSEPAPPSDVSGHKPHGQVDSCAACGDCASRILPHGVAAAYKGSAINEDQPAPASQAPVKSVGHGIPVNLLAGDRVGLSLGGRENFVGKILLTPAADKALGYMGVLEGERQGEFLFYPLKDGRIRGQIHLPSEGRGYVFFLNTDGTVYKEENELDHMPTICPPVPGEIQAAYAAGIPATGSAAPKNLELPATPPDIPKFNSLPGATAVLYLDFDGEFLPQSPWNGGNDIDALPVYGQDGTLTEQELAQIHLIWSEVAEDFLPFNINVTTERAVYDAAPNTRRAQCVFTPTKYFTNPAFGGVAGIGSFHRDLINTQNKICFVFEAPTSFMAGTASHELGHTLKLTHDGDSVNEYYPGHGSGRTKWATIMGAYVGDVGVMTWSKGEYTDANNTQDDLAIITDSDNGFGYRADDHGNTDGTASDLLAGGGLRNYRIRVGDYYRGTMTKLFFAAADEAHSSANSQFRSIKIYEDGATVPASLNFNSYTLEPYNGGGTGTASLSNGNRALNLTGNIWRAISFPYTVTKDTILEFDFQSSSEGEVHAIGFDTDLVASADRGFQMLGTEEWGLPAFRRSFLPVNRYQTKQHQTGIIETTSDVDVFRIVSPGGSFTALVTAANLNDRMANLDIKLELYDAGGALLKTSDPAGDVHANISHSSAAGTVHYLHVHGTGVGAPLATPPTGYTDYASLGHYQLELRSLDSLSPDPMTWVSAPAEFPPLSSGLTAGTLAGNNPATGQPWQDSDLYRLAFVTSATTQATSTDITAYNTFVQGLANAAGLGGTTWKVLGSTAAVNARDNTATNPAVNGAGESIYLVDGSTLVATGYADLWDGTINSPIILDENGATRDPEPNRIFTGTWTGGTYAAGDDGPLGYAGVVQTGRSDHSNNSWVQDWKMDSTSSNSVYALSDPIPLSLSIKMEATPVAGTDGVAVEYYFAETSGNPGGDDSGWQASPFYIDSGLTPGLTYSYTVKARYVDLAASETAVSASASVTTNLDATPPTPNPASFALPPAAVSDTEISMSATTGTDPSGPVEYLFTETSGNPGATSSAWQTSPSYTDSGLDPFTQYTYTVTLRDSLGNVGSASTPASATTLPEPGGPTTLTANSDWATGTWNNGIPGAGIDAVVAAGIAATANNPVAPWSGSLTLNAGASLSVGTNGTGALTNATTLIMKGATIFDAFGNTQTLPPITLDGGGSFDSTTSNDPHVDNRTFAGPITGTGGFSIWGNNRMRYDFNASNNFTGGLFIDARDRYIVAFNATGSAGAGNVTVDGRANNPAGQNQNADNRSAVLRLGADDVFVPTATLTLNGAGWAASSGSDYALQYTRIDMQGYNATVARLFIDGVEKPPGAYSGNGINNTDINDSLNWIRGTGTLTVGAPQTPYQQWAALFPGADLSNPAEDLDGDGLSNDAERLWGLDPTKATSSSPISSMIDASSGAFSYTRGNPTLSGATYGYQWSETLTPESWQFFTPAAEIGDTASPVETVQVTLPANLLGKTRLFVRVAVTPASP